LIDDIINAINEVLYRCTDSFETGLLSADPALLGFADRYSAEGRTPEKDEDGNDHFPEARLEVEEGVLKLETLMENAVDKNFDRLEIWTLRNVLCLPRGEEELVNWVRLGHYEVRNHHPCGIRTSKLTRHLRSSKHPPKTQISRPKPSTHSAAN
jgi:kinetochore protein Mis12/MTW1